MFVGKTFVQTPHFLANIKEKALQVRASPDFFPCDPSASPPPLYFSAVPHDFFPPPTPGMKKRRIDFFETHKKEDDSSARRLADHLFLQAILTRVFQFGTLQHDSALDEAQGKAGFFSSRCEDWLLSFLLGNRLSRFAGWRCSALLPSATGRRRRDSGRRRTGCFPRLGRSLGPVSRFTEKQS